MGVVFYANYLDWFEIGRTDLCRQWGVPYAEWEKQGVFLPCVEARCRYKRPARYDETVTLVTAVETVRRNSISFTYVVENEDGRVCAEGWTKHGFCDAHGKLLRHPEKRLPLLENLTTATTPER
ncbi:MAG: acyl-CoA thioesterase [Synergistales bacterium]|nr:acyl-CoA thioesterase [Synergistales bacterium]